MRPSSPPRWHRPPAPARRRSPRRRRSTARTRVKLALITPLTGGGGFIGQEQLAWAQVRGEDPGEEVRPQGAAPAGRHPGREGQRRGSRRRPEVHLRPERPRRDRPCDLGRRRRGERGAHRGGHRPDLAVGDPDVADEGCEQGGDERVLPRRARRLHPGAERRELHGGQAQGQEGRDVDFQEPYSVGLADAAEAVLKKKDVSVTRQSTSVNTTDFSSLVTRVPNDADIVFFPTQQPADAQTFAQQMLEQGKKAKVFGGDGTNSPTAFKVAGSYVSNFAPGHQRHPGEQGADRRVEEGQPERDARLVRPAHLSGRRGRAERDQEGVRRAARARSRTGSS